MQVYLKLVQVKISNNQSVEGTGCDGDRLPRSTGRNDSGEEAFGNNEVRVISGANLPSIVPDQVRAIRNANLLCILDNAPPLPRS